MFDFVSKTNLSCATLIYKYAQCILLQNPKKCALILGSLFDFLQTKKTNLAFVCGNHATIMIQPHIHITHIYFICYGTSFFLFLEH